jgi:hypothetical protein
MQIHLTLVYYNKLCNAKKKSYILKSTVLYVFRAMVEDILNV